jgi:hypothetical protein
VKGKRKEQSQDDETQDDNQTGVVGHMVGQFETMQRRIMAEALDQEPHNGVA